MAITFEQYLPFRNKPDQAVAAMFDISATEVKQMKDFAVTIEADFKQRGQIPSVSDFVAAWNIKIATPMGFKLAAPGPRLAGQVPEAELIEAIAQKVVDKLRPIIGK